jgi:spore coat polysaccharide biosynthesis protein SpsF
VLTVVLNRNDLKIGAIIQARMSSERLPGKVLAEVAGKPLLRYILERLEHCESLDEIVVATSLDESDTPVEEYCRDRGVPCYRGSLDDVAGRFTSLLREHPFNVFVRVNGDSPLLDQGLITSGIELFQSGDFDLVTNIFPRSFPKGQSVEIIRAVAFVDAYERMREKAELEHITRYFYMHPKEYRIHNFTHSENLNNIQLSIDTADDLKVFSAIISQMSRPHWEYALDEILPLYHRISKRVRADPS